MYRHIHMCAYPTNLTDETYATLESIYIYKYIYLPDELD